MTPDEPPELHARAMDNLQFIRETMESAASFTAISGWGMVGVGAIGLAATLIVGRSESLPRWLAVWLPAAGLSLLVSVGSTLRKARRAGLPILSGPGRKLLIGFLPPMLVGAVLTAVLASAGMGGAMRATWLLAYGSAVITGGAYSVRIIPVMGICFMLLGVVALAVPAEWSPVLMAAGFGGLHLAFGLAIARRHGG